MRFLEIHYNCPSCGAKSIEKESVQTEQPDEELLKRVAHQIICPNPNCKSAGRPQDLEVSRIVPA